MEIPVLTFPYSWILWIRLVHWWVHYRVEQLPPWQNGPECLSTSLVTSPFFSACINVLEDLAFFPAQSCWTRWEGLPLLVASTLCLVWYKVIVSKQMPVGLEPILLFGCSSTFRMLRKVLFETQSPRLLFWGIGARQLLVVFPWCTYGSKESDLTPQSHYCALCRALWTRK